MLAAEMGAVMWLRSLRMMGGGRLTEREAHRMVNEKVAAGIMWPFAMMTGGMLGSSEDAASRMLAHYRRPVRANRRRLSR